MEENKNPIETADKTPEVHVTPPLEPQAIEVTQSTIARQKPGTLFYVFLLMTVLSGLFILFQILPLLNSDDGSGLTGAIGMVSLLCAAPVFVTGLVGSLLSFGKKRSLPNNASNFQTTPITVIQATQGHPKKGSFQIFFGLLVILICVEVVMIFTEKPLALTQVLYIFWVPGNEIVGYLLMNTGFLGIGLATGTLITIQSVVILGAFVSLFRSSKWKSTNILLGIHTKYLWVAAILFLLVVPEAAAFVKDTQDTNERTISTQRAIELIEQCKIERVMEAGEGYPVSVYEVRQPEQSVLNQVIYDVPSANYIELSRKLDATIYIDGRCPQLDTRSAEDKALTISENEAVKLIVDCKIEELDMDTLPTVYLKDWIYTTNQSGVESTVSSYSVKTENYDLLKEKLAISRESPLCQQ